MHGNVHVCFIPIWIVIISVGCINGDLNITGIQNYWNVIGRYKRQSSCRPDQFMCKSGSCVLEDNECDGEINCADGSDEADCSNFRCASNLFQCAYGACIKRSFYCDGKTDCKDNSDEAPPCKSATTQSSILCGVGEFQCSSGNCIDEELLCDGKADCPDNSDETSKECGSLPCAAQIFFRCDYGACLHKSVKCNGVKDCFDGSDERGCPGRVTTKKPPTPSPPTKKPPTPTIKKPTTATPPAGSCIVPPNPANGVYKVGATNANAGDFAPMFSALVLNCKVQFKPNPPTKAMIPLCLNGQWSLTPPSCARFCSPIKSSATTRVQCRFGGKPLDNCDDPIEGTIASLECEPLYEEPGISRNPNRVCKDGTWDYTIPQCLPVCGEKRPLGTPNVVGGQIAKQGDYPWHVGIYHNTNGHLCGGSIINQRVVISAAHCFADNDGKLYPTENYKIAAGKYYRTYDDSRDIRAQYSDIDRIYIHERYRGIINNYEADLAVIVLTTPFSIAVNVQPVCVDWKNEFEFKQLIENNIGVVVGWGYTVTGGNPSEELKEIDVPFKPYSECVEQVPVSFQKFLTHDKICAGYLYENKSVCQGDSGGGLTFEWNQNRYYLRGIVSTSPSSKESGIISCDPNQYGTYTLISKHIDFIKDIEVLNRT